MVRRNDDDDLPKEIADEINARSNELIEEFREHAAGFHELMKAEHPEILARDGGLDRGKIFEGWAIQKIASLQLLVLQLIDRVGELESKQRKR